MYQLHPLQAAPFLASASNTCQLRVVTLGVDEAAPWSSWPCVNETMRAAENVIARIICRGRSARQKSAAGSSGAEPQTLHSIVHFSTIKATKYLLRIRTISQNVRSSSTLPLQRPSPPKVSFSLTPPFQKSQLINLPTHSPPLTARVRNFFDGTYDLLGLYVASLFSVRPSVYPIINDCRPLTLKLARCLRCRRSFVLQC